MKNIIESFNRDIGYDTDGGWFHGSYPPPPVLKPGLEKRIDTLEEKVKTLIELTNKLVDGLIEKEENQNPLKDL